MKEKHIELTKPSTRPLNAGKSGAGPKNKARKMGTDFVVAVQAEIDQENRLAAQSLLSRKHEPLRLFASKMTLCFSVNLCVSTPRNPKTGQSSGTRSAISSGKTKLNTISGQGLVYRDSKIHPQPRTA